ncbi:MAG: DNA replication and repair protein RecF [Actinomycetota bacterium]
MLATAVTLRDFRNVERAEVRLGSRLTVIAGPNGAGKTNLLEGIYFAATARSPRTNIERELVRRGSSVARVTLATEDGEGGHLIEVGLAPGDSKTVKLDGAPAEDLIASPVRPLVSVFLPDRLALVKGAPSGRRGHLDDLVAALWPGRRATRTAYSRALAQRNALLARVRSGVATRSSLASWDTELAREGVQLMADRAEAAELLAPRFAELARELGLPGPAELSYRPRSPARNAGELAAELLERREADLQRGFTAHGPHRDELRLAHDGQALRSYGSQGQQRVALLALLFAERDILAAERARPPLMLLDDVMSELDSARRELLSELLRAGGQGVVTTTDAEHVPGAGEDGVELVCMADGRLMPSSRAGEVAA